MIFFFTCLAFSVGTAQTYLEEDMSRDARRARRERMQRAPPNERMYRLKFDKMIENALDVLRLCCISFCGPTVLAECLVTLVWYPEIVRGCKQIPDGFMNVLVYVLLILGAISVSVSAFLVYSVIFLGKTIKQVWPQILNPPPALPEEEEEDDLDMEDANQFRSFAGQTRESNNSSRLSYV